MCMGIETRHQVSIRGYRVGVYGLQATGVEAIGTAIRQIMGLGIKEVKYV